MNVNNIKSQIKWNLFRVPPDKLEEINDFIEFILYKEQKQKNMKIVNLEGIWEGIGFEKILNLEDSIREIRSK